MPKGDPAGYLPRVKRARKAIGMAKSVIPPVTKGNEKRPWLIPRGTNGLPSAPSLPSKPAGDKRGPGPLPSRTGIEGSSYRARASRSGLGKYKGSKFNPFANGGVSAGDRIRRSNGSNSPAEDDSDFDPKRHGNRRYRARGRR